MFLRHAPSDLEPRNAAVRPVCGSTHRNDPDYPKCPKVFALAARGNHVRTF